MDVTPIRNKIRDVPDFPKPGIIFKDITPVLADPKLFRMTIDAMIAPFVGLGVTKIAAIDARGFLFAGALAERLNAGLVPIRKKGKLPYKIFEESYSLEYGEANLAIHQDAFVAGDRVLLIDDVLATGGTAAASANLVGKAGGNLVGISFMIELGFLNGRARLGNVQTNAVLLY
jgi:adenine phosphoribosyltransferase